MCNAPASRPGRPLPATLALAAALLTSLAPPAMARADDPTPSAPPDAMARPKDAPFPMEAFQLVLLMRAPTARKLPDAEAKALQAAHLAHLTRMAETGKAVVCGPFDRQEDVAFRGACIYAVRTIEEARDLAGQDPIVKAGQLRVEAMTWWVGRGDMTFPRAPPDPTR